MLTILILLSTSYALKGFAGSQPFQLIIHIQGCNKHLKKQNALALLCWFDEIILSTAVYMYLCLTEKNWKGYKRKFTNTNTKRDSIAFYWVALCLLNASKCFKNMCSVWLNISLRETLDFSKGTMEYTVGERHIRSAFI